MANEHSPTHYEIGMVGLGVMGRNLLLNMADHGFAVAVMPNCSRNSRLARGWEIMPTPSKAATASGRNFTAAQPKNGLSINPH
jgi:3-hydroxyisobutyrate dehydrogenase-like beta-hydroxyacid dehydrogenase